MLARSLLRRAAAPLVARGARGVSTAARSQNAWSMSQKIVAVGSAGIGLSMATGNPEVAHALSSTVDWNAVRKDIVAVIEAEDQRREDGTGIGPTFVRLAWHASGTYSKFDKTGGSNGAHMRFCPEGTIGANQGLSIARMLLLPIQRKHGCSFADLWTFAGKVVVEEAGGPVIPWRPGRTDADDGTKAAPDGRLPDATQGAAHIRDVFYRMGFNDQEIVALSGAHALGRCEESNSGFWGPWTNAETTFSNEYFRLLLEEKWTPKKTHKGKPWKGPLQYEDKSGNLMMLPTDMALVQDPVFKKYVEAYARDSELFEKDFAAAFGKLMELGVPFPAAGGGGLFGSLKGLLGLK